MKQILKQKVFTKVHFISSVQDSIECIHDNITPFHQQSLYLSLQKCIYCLPFTKKLPVSGACTQCSVGRCTLSFHVTCAHAVGVSFENSDWPFPIHVTCMRHNGTKDVVSYALASNIVKSLFTFKLFSTPIFISPLMCWSSFTLWKSESHSGRKIFASNVRAFH